MENASKALIIAGAILISIVLIAVGVMVVNGANGAINQAINNMSDSEKQMFNSRFTSYEGNQKGSSVKALLNQVVTSNDDKDTALYVEVTVISGPESSQTTKECGTNANTIAEAKAAIKNSASYEVIFDYSSGVINKITITEKAK